jgi:hypothetical protein
VALRPPTSQVMDVPCVEPQASLHTPGLFMSSGHREGEENGGGSLSRAFHRHAKEGDHPKVLCVFLFLFPCQHVCATQDDEGW